MVEQLPRRPDTPIISKERAPGRNFDLHDNPDSMEIFADGVSQTLLGPAISKVDFHKTVSAEANSTGEVLEVRQIVMRVSIPTAQLIEFMVSLLGQISSNPQPLLDAIDQNRTSMVSQLQSLGSSHVAAKP